MPPAISLTVIWLAPASKRVIDQFAHDRGRALDHLAGGNLADQLVGQLADVCGEGAARPHRRLAHLRTRGRVRLLRHPRIVGGDDVMNRLIILRMEHRSLSHQFHFAR
jgi:hypothetical protein